MFWERRCLPFFDLGILLVFFLPLYSGDVRKRSEKLKQRRAHIGLQQHPSITIGVRTPFLFGDDVRWYIRASKAEERWAVTWSNVMPSSSPWWSSFFTGIGGHFFQYTKNMVYILDGYAWTPPLYQCLEGWQMTRLEGIDAIAKGGCKRGDWRRSQKEWGNTPRGRMKGFYTPWGVADQTLKIHFVLDRWHQANLLRAGFG